MTGRLTIAGDRWVELTGDGWKSSPPELANLLTAALPPDGISPADGDPGVHLLESAREMLGGDIVYEDDVGDEDVDPEEISAAEMVY